MKFPEIALLAKPRPHQVAALSAIGAVLKRNGYRVRETFDMTAPESVVFCWSWGKAMIQRQKHPDSIICTLDHGYTPDRAKLINTGWSLPNQHCGLNGFAEHALVEDPSRAEAMWPKRFREDPIAIGLTPRQAPPPYGLQPQLPQQPTYDPRAPQAPH